MALAKSAQNRAFLSETVSWMTLVLLTVLTETFFVKFWPFSSFSEYGTPSGSRYCVRSSLSRAFWRFVVDVISWTSVSILEELDVDVSRLSIDVALEIGSTSALAVASYVGSVILR